MEISSALADHISVFKYIKSENDPLSVYANDLQKVVLLRDRFGELNKFSNWNFNTQLDVFPDKHIEIPFKEICFNEVNHIYDRAVNENKDIYISWSGGVDSTLVAVLLIYTIPEKVILLHTSESLQEYARLFYFSRNLNIRTKHILPETMPYWYREITKDNLLITGWPADILFGTDILIDDHRIKPYLYKPYQQFLLAHNGIKFVDQFDLLIKSTELKIEKTIELMWLMNFVCRWKPAIWNTLINCTNAGNLINFYDNQEFQKYAVRNYYKIRFIPDIKPTQYKKELKDIIISYTKDNNFIYKTKVKSWNKFSKQSLEQLTIKTDSGFMFLKPSLSEYLNFLKQFKK